MGDTFLQKRLMTPTRQCLWQTKIASICVELNIRQSVRCSPSWIREFMGVSASQPPLEKRSGT